MGPLIRWEPFGAVSRLRDDMNRLLADFFGETPDEHAPREMARIPHADLIDRENAFEVKVEMPGIDKDSLQVQATPEALTLRAEVHRDAEHTGENVLRRERYLGVFQRVIPLPAEVKPDEVKATYHDGVLEIILPKSEQAKARQPVKVRIDS